MSDDWGDIEDGDRLLPGRGSYGRRRSTGPGREQRLAMTLGAAAVLLLLIGLGIGFAIGHRSAPPVQQQPIVATETPTVAPEPVVATPTVEPTPTPVAAEPTVTVSAEPSDTTAPRVPTQISPDDGAHLAGPRTTIKWSKVTDPSTPVKYYVDLWTFVDGTTWSKQVLGPLNTASYSVRVTAMKRRWRVWAVDGKGNVGKKSDWSYFFLKEAPAKSKPSTDTSSH